MMPDIASTAALFGDPVRAAMLVSLLDARSRPAGELAFVGNISPQTASFHLAKLTEAGLLVVEKRGRHSFYRLSGAPVASAIESLAALAPPRQATRFNSEPLREMRAARSCYRHLAGRLGVRVHDALLETGILLQRNSKEYVSTNHGRDALEKLGINLPAEAIAKPCEDWTERVPHLGGPLAGQLLSQFLQNGWLARIGDSRALRITHAGESAFEALLQVSLLKRSRSTDFSLCG